MKRVSKMAALAKSDDTNILPKILVDHVESDNKLEPVSNLKEENDSLTTAVKGKDIETKVESNTIQTLCEVCIQADESMAIAVCKNCDQLLCHVCHLTHRHDGTTQEDKSVSNKRLPQPLTNSTRTYRKWSIGSLEGDLADREDLRQFKQSRKAHRKWSICSTGSDIADIEETSNKFKQTAKTHRKLSIGSLEGDIAENLRLYKQSRNTQRKWSIGSTGSDIADIEESSNRFKPSAKTRRKWSITSIESEKADKAVAAETQLYKQAEFLGQVEVKSISDTHSVSVSGIESLPNGFLFVCDNGNNKLKLFGLRSEFLSEVCLTSEPGGFAFLNSKNAIISLPEERCLQKVRLRKRANLVLQEKWRTIFKCFKLVKFHGNLITSSQDNFNFFIHVIDTEGRVLRCIYNEPKSTSRILQNLNTLVLSRDWKEIILVHQSLGCIGLLLSGGMSFGYREPGEHFHTGVCSDIKGNLFVGCYIDDKIVMINKYGQKLCDFLTFKRMNPESIYLSNDAKLYVFSGSTKKLYCYRMKY